MDFNSNSSCIIEKSVRKNKMSKLLNINSRFRNNYYSTKSTDFSIQLPFQIKNVINMSLESTEIPHNFYSFSSELGTNEFTIEMYEEQFKLLSSGANKAPTVKWNVGTDTYISYDEKNPPIKTNIKKYIIKIKDGNYTGKDLERYLNEVVFSNNIFKKGSNGNPDTGAYQRYRNVNLGGLGTETSVSNNSYTQNQKAALDAATSAAIAAGSNLTGSLNLSTTSKKATNSLVAAQTKKSEEERKAEEERNKLEREKSQAIEDARRREEEIRLAAEEKERIRLAEQARKDAEAKLTEAKIKETEAKALILVYAAEEARAKKAEEDAIARETAAIKATQEAKDAASLRAAEEAKAKARADKYAAELNKLKAQQKKKQAEIDAAVAEADKIRKEDEAKKKAAE